MRKTPFRRDPFLRGWLRFERSLARDVDHDSVLDHVREEGVLTTRYVVMTALAAAIATLGLLMSSVAVLIGAMLLSPLMGPIMLLGFAFRRLDVRAMRQALIGVAVGFLVALVVGIIVTLVSPLKEPTTEIMARVHPTLFDLGVAVFSGLAGGYAVIKRKGETAIGVALAIALLPPINVVGFGLAIGSISMALNALLMFATNLIATVLAAALVAAAYGFRPTVAKTAHGVMGGIVVVLVIVALCVPLTLSLQSIVGQSRLAGASRAAVTDLFGPDARLANLVVTPSRDVYRIDALVATPTAVADAPERLRAAIAQSISLPIDLRLSQIVMANPAVELETASRPTLDAAHALQESLRAAVPFPAETAVLDAASGRGAVLLPADTPLDLAASRALELALRGKPGLAAAEVTPPLQPLTPAAVTFPVRVEGEGEVASLDDAAMQTDLWALRRWRPRVVEFGLCGVAQARAGAVEAALSAALFPSRVERFIAARQDCLDAPSGGDGAVLLRPAL